MKGVILLCVIFCHFVLNAQDIIPFRSVNNWYYVYENGSRVSGKTYQFATPFYYDGKAAVKVDGEFGFIDHHERFLFDARYDSATTKNDRLTVFEKGETFYVTWNTGLRIWKRPSGCGSGGGLVGSSLNRVFKENGKMGVYYNIDTLLVPVYDSISIPYHTEVIIVYDNGKVGICNQGGYFTVPVELDSIKIVRDEFRYSSIERVEIYLNGKIGAVNLVGNIIAKPKYNNLHFDYADTPFTILENGKIGYIYKGKEYWKD